MNNYFANNIRHLRKERNMTQTELGNALGGKKKSTIASYESGARLPVASDLKTFAEFFHISTDRLMYEDLAYVADLDATLKADWIREELLRLRLSDKEFDMVENYIQFIVSQRSKNAGL